MKNHKLIVALLGLLLFIAVVVGIAIAGDPPLDTLDGTKDR